MSEVFITIITGVVLFIFSQYILEMIIKPRAKLLKCKANLSNRLLEYHAEYMGESLLTEQIIDIQKASGNLLAHVYSFSKMRSKRIKY